MPFSASGEASFGPRSPSLQPNFLSIVFEAWIPPCTVAGHTELRNRLPSPSDLAEEALVAGQDLGLNLVVSARGS